MINNINSNSSYLQTERYIKKTAAANNAAISAGDNSSRTSDASDTSNSAKRVLSIEDLLISMQRLKRAENSAATAASTLTADTSTSASAIDTLTSTSASASQSQPAVTSDQNGTAATGSQATQTEGSDQTGTDASTDQAQTAASLLNSIDADGDGTISADEYNTLVSQLGIEDAPSAEDIFSLFDTNSDGEISSDEFNTVAQSMRPPMGPPPTERPEEETQTDISGIDTDGDGTISADEYEAFVSEAGVENAPSATDFFTQYDTNSDGEISSDEIDAVNEKMASAMQTQPNEPEVIPSDIDADGDGSVSADEYETLVSQTGVEDALSAEDFFKEYDTNSDGEISEEEIIDALEKAQENTTSENTSENSNVPDSETAQNLSAEYQRRAARAFSAYEGNYIYQFEGETEDTGSIA